MQTRSVSDRGIAAYGLAKGGSVKVYGSGNSGEEIRSIQKMLLAAGYDPGRADGSFGKVTERAVKEFQLVHGLTADGRVGKETLGALKAMSVPNPRPRPKGLGAFGDDMHGMTHPTGANAEGDIINPELPGSGIQRAANKYKENAAPKFGRDMSGMTHPTGSNARGDLINPELPGGDVRREANKFGEVLKPAPNVTISTHEEKMAKGGLAQMGMPPKEPESVDMSKATPFKSGMIKSVVPGRTDRLPLVVDKNAFVWPADLVSGLGQGNSDAGAHILGELLSHYEGINDGPDGNGQNDEPVPIVAAGGEFVTDPNTVAAVGGGDMNKGHKLLKGAVMSLRKQIANHMLTLPGPKG